MEKSEERSNRMDENGHDSESEGYVFSEEEEEEEEEFDNSPDFEAENSQKRKRRNGTEKVAVKKAKVVGSRTSSRIARIETSRKEQEELDEIMRKGNVSPTDIRKSGKKMSKGELAKLLEERKLRPTIEKAPTRQVQKNETKPRKSSKKIEKLFTKKKKPTKKVVEEEPCRVCLQVDVDDVDNNVFIFCDKCDMPVHQKCYSVIEIPEGDWFCRRCQIAQNDGSSISKGSNGVKITTFCSKSSEFNGLYRNSDFAALINYFYKFGETALHLVPITINALGSALVNPVGSSLLESIHITLLKKVGFSRVTTDNWQQSLTKFLNNANSMQNPSLNDSVSRLFIFSGEINEVNPLLSVQYEKLSLDSRVQILKILCEEQFDLNDSFMNFIREEFDSEQLREASLGSDSSNVKYWLVEDGIDFWICSSVSDKKWETVCSNLDELDELIKAFSLSCHSSDLHLWASLERNIKPFLVKRQRKRNRQEARLARENSRLSGMDYSSVFDGPDRRSRRSRKQIDYTYKNFDDSISHVLSNDRSGSNGTLRRSTRTIDEPVELSQEDLAKQREIRVRERNQRSQTRANSSFENDLSTEDGSKVLID